MTFFDALAEQRWDDHRFYHHSRINQSLHLISALAFVVSYSLLLTRPAIAVLIAWLLAMPSRQLGHFFFEPKGYDHDNHATHEHKEAVKVGYNLQRKVVLMTVWLLSPILLRFSPDAWGLLSPAESTSAMIDNVAIVWLWVGAGAVVARTVQLFFIRDVQTGLVWAAKIITDPFHDIALYYRAPLHVWRGEYYDPIVEERAA